MHHPDCKRFQRQPQPVSVPVVRLPGMAMQVHVRLAVVLMRMQMPSFPDEGHRQRYTQRDQHEAHAELQRHRDPLGNRDLEQDDGQAHQQQDGGVAEPPAKADKTGCAEIGTIGEDRGDRRDVIGIQGVARPQEEPQAQDGEEF